MIEWDYWRRRQYLVTSLTENCRKQRFQCEQTSLVGCVCMYSVRWAGRACAGVKTNQIFRENSSNTLRLTKTKNIYRFYVSEIEFYDVSCWETHVKQASLSITMTTGWVFERPFIAQIFLMMPGAFSDFRKSHGHGRNVGFSPLTQRASWQVVGPILVTLHTARYLRTHHTHTTRCLVVNITTPQESGLCRLWLGDRANYLGIFTRLYV